MSHVDSEKSKVLLANFLQQSVSLGEAGIKNIKPLENVTALLYFFWDTEVADEKWFEFEGAILETWRNCGCLKTVIVTNTDHACVKTFAERFSNVQVQIESRLVPGDVNSMSVDCNLRLYKRFDTEFVLIVQNDGFPLRPGLERFVKKGYDFIGAPYCRPFFRCSLATWLCNYCPSNGGFSLRTRRMCKLASELWSSGNYSSREFKVMEMSEDLFYTNTLPRAGFKYWVRRRQAPSRTASHFSFEPAFSIFPKKMPLGFHTADAFDYLAKHFGVEFANSAVVVNSLEKKKGE